MTVLPPFTALVELAPRLRVVDIGANPINEVPPYMPLLRAGLAEVVGFEPNPEALAELNAKKGPNERYLPFAVGDGGRHVLRVCAASGMTSLLPPDAELLGYFHGFPHWGRVLSEVAVDTVRLDDLEEVGAIDYLKIDIQGGELMVFENATETLRGCLAIHTEVEFLPLYAGQPLFAEVDQFMRRHGFVLHTLLPLEKRTVAPLSGGEGPDLGPAFKTTHAEAVRLLENAFGGNPHAGLNQVLWTDAVFVRDFTRLALLDTEQLAKYALLLHDVYRSYDLALRALMELDARTGTLYATAYAANIAMFSGGAYRVPGLITA
ncbi:FkbM family methyltransferase [Azospirillum sp.]|uniref:FkbM family methyltransferase n=1 Tax=Azospirillum sp. TaxID=34012 RepID=UPI003D7477A2